MTSQTGNGLPSDPSSISAAAAAAAAAGNGTASVLSQSQLWDQIEVSESYLVCRMFEEAASESASVIRYLHTAGVKDTPSESQLADMMESAAMVFVQSLKELGRTFELLTELQTLFGSVVAIPVDVFLTGVCMQISEGISANLKDIFEEFLANWTHLEDDVYVSTKAKPESLSSKGFFEQSVMSADKYIQVAEVYALTFLGTILRSPDLAISWTEKAELPEEKRQDILRRLCSLHLAKDSSSSLGPGKMEVGPSVSGTGSIRNFPTTTSPLNYANGDKAGSTVSKFINPTIKRISGRIDPYLWWFRLKVGNIQYALPRKKIMLLSFLMLFTYYYFVRKRSAALKRSLARQVLSIKRALVDAWQLAFSVQVNPLAAVQQLPAATRGSR